MGTFRAEIILPRPVAEIFDFLSRPKNLEALAPASEPMELLQGPEHMAEGILMEWRVVRMGLPQRIVTKVTGLEKDRLLKVEQEVGPLGKYQHTQTLSETGDQQTTLRDEIEFEPPSGILGMMITEQWVENNLKAGLEYRDKKLQELFS